MGEILLDLTGTGEIYTHMNKEDYEAAQRTRRRYEEDMRLLDDLGWDPEQDADEFEITMDRGALAHALRRLNLNAGEVLDHYVVEPIESEFTLQAAIAQTAYGSSASALSGYASLAGMHASQISRLENGLADPKVSTVVRVARALNVRVCELIEGPSEPDPHQADDPEEEGIVLIASSTGGLAMRSGRSGDWVYVKTNVALAAGRGLRAVGEIEAGKPTAQFNTWLAVIQALGFKLVIVGRRDQSSP